MIAPMRLSEIARALALQPPRRDPAFDGVSTDSRAIRAGELFVALSGERFDGHDFVGVAAQRGAVAVLCAREMPNCPLPVLVVPDTLLALGRVALLNRQRFEGTLVALTGSAGKTTTKEMIAAILGTRGRVLATEGNLNNEIGVPLTLLRIGAQDRFAVIEMGASRAGDIRYLASLARPDVALVTNALEAHLEGFGSVEDVAAAKAEIYDALPPGGAAVLNLDARFAAAWRTRIGSRRVIGASLHAGAAAEVWSSGLRMHEGFAQFRLCTAAAEVDVVLRVPGTHQVGNALMAAAVGVALGIEERAIGDALQSVLPVRGRMCLLRGANGSRLIDDSYNANPGSVRAAIDSLAGFAGLRVLVLGNMAELGDAAAALHRDVGEYARRSRIDRLLCTGEHAHAVAEAFGAGGRAFTSCEELCQACREYEHEGVTILVKGSRSAAMERVVAALVGATAREPAMEVH